MTGDYRDIESAVFGQIQNAEGFVRVNCPRCSVKGPLRPDHRLSLAYRPESGWFECWRCHTQGRLRGQGSVVYKPNIPRQDTAVVEVYPPQGIVSVFSNGLTPARARKYLAGRGVPEETWARAELCVGVFGPLFGRLVVPVFSTEGGWWGYSARDMGGTSQRKYLYPPKFSRGRVLYAQAELLRATSDPIVLVEGVFDVLPHFGFCVGSLGKPTQDQLRLVAKTKRPVFVMLDGDAWRDTKAAVLQLQLLGCSAKGVRLDPGQDPGVTSPSEFFEAIRKAK